MLRILEPHDIRAAVAVALAYFTALRPAEIRGLRWSDYDGTELNIQRAIWRGHEGETNTEGSAVTVPVIANRCAGCCRGSAPCTGATAISCKMRITAR